MPRVKGGYVTRRRRKRVIKLAKGYYGSKHALYKTAHEQVMRSLAYSYRDRKVRKRDFRKLWITRINAACQLNDMKYSRFINGLTRAGIEINRKMLSELAISDANGFASLVEVAKQGLINAPVKKVETPKFFNPAAKKVEKVAEVKAEPKKVAKVEQKKIEEVKTEVKKTTKATPKKVEEVKTEAKKTTKAKPKKAEEVKAEPKVTLATVDLETLTVSGLRELAKAKNIKGYSTMKKADLIAALK